MGQWPHRLEFERLLHVHNLIVILVHVVQLAIWNVANLVGCQNSKDSFRSYRLQL